MSDGADTEILQQCDVVGGEGESLSKGVSATTLGIRRQPIPIMMMMMMVMMMDDMYDNDDDDNDDDDDDNDDDDDG